MTDFATIREICGKKKNLQRKGHSFHELGSFNTYGHSLSSNCLLHPYRHNPSAQPKEQERSTPAFTHLVCVLTKLLRCWKASVVCLAMEPGEVNQKSGKSINTECKASPSGILPSYFPGTVITQASLLWFFKLIRLIWLRFFVWYSATPHNTDWLGPVLRLKALKNSKLTHAATFFPTATSFHCLPVFAYLRCLHILIFIFCVLSRIRCFYLLEDWSGRSY